MDCIFCKIINKEIFSYKVYEDELVYAFLNNCPDSVGHTLILPKKHVKDLFEIDNDTLIHIIEVAKVIEKKLKEKFNIDGFTLVQNNGCAQEIKHFHIHLKPYYNESLEMPLEEVYNILMSN